MNKKRYPFWLRFIFFNLVFAVAFFLIVFIVDRDPFDNYQTLLIKIGILAPISSLLYNILIGSEPEVVD